MRVNIELYSDLVDRGHTVVSRAGDFNRRG